MSDLWGWVHASVARLREGEAPQQRLAELIEALPSATADDAHSRVDTLFPEALALARSLEEPWLELFIRHWNLQSRVLHRYRAQEELRDAVELLEFASREDTKRCPQSVCVVQDLACCYSISDGPGYVDERLAVARETLARIDPSWPCFDCISAEYFSALMDDQRPQEALAFVEAQRAALAERGIFELGSNLSHDRIRALLVLGRAEQAEEMITAMRDVAELGDSYAMDHRNLRVAVLLALGRVDEAEALHPSQEAIVDTPSHYEVWLDNLAELIAAGRVTNDARVGVDVLELQQRLEQNGAKADAVHACVVGLRLALAREAREVSRLLVEDLERLRARLRRPERVLPQAQLDALKQQLAAIPPIVDPQLPPEQRVAVAEAMLGRADMEPSFDLFVLLDTLGAGDPLALASILRQLGRPGAALGELRAQLEASATAEVGEGGMRLEILVLELAAALNDLGDYAGFDALLDEHADTLRTDMSRERLAWVRGTSLVARGDLEAAMANDERTIEALGEDAYGGGFLERLAWTARSRKDWPRALAALDRLVATRAPGDLDWDRMTVATALGDWARVRDSGGRLAVLSSEVEDPHAPIELQRGREAIRCEFVEDSGERQRYWALRTSPCGARVVELAFPHDPQHYGDEVAFDAFDLDPDAGDASEGPPCFEVVAVCRRGGWRSFLLRGFNPGAEGLAAFTAAIADAGFVIERISAEDRSAMDPREIAVGEAATEESPSEVPTLALLIGLPEDEPPQRLRSIVAAAIASWPLPLLCPQLDRACGDEQAASAAAAYLERWDP
ncbi:hypothetical protein G6O69_34280 [Pseudenhygromyxa sp. WMMC2535]|uniref:hypothetical protein n=1 Tax=Pseudenhygromyxa sp. WMMC2535 TaxID=2712867 RepID=UPI0015558CCC|nr:hypothetical protein [Pseudenhygromyxa sp. WMMC2535]NVB42940.1 hypothetical protein [Pseudenhygromyxa sp. WMMC2535]